MARWQQTLQRCARFQGHGLHSNLPVSINVQPALPGHGIKFRLLDKEQNVRSEIPAIVNSTLPTSSLLCTKLHGGEYSVSTVEHLLAAVHAMQITNADIDVSTTSDTMPKELEIPIMDGSSLPFVQALSEAGVTSQSKVIDHYLRVQKPVQVVEKDRAAWFLPHPPNALSNAPMLQVHAQVNFAHRGLGTRSYQMTLDNDPENTTKEFRNEYAPARTFTFEDEIELMWKNGLAKGGSLDNAIVFRPTKDNNTSVLNEGGLRLKGEWARHKLLDCIGDLALTPAPVHGIFFSTSPGHALTHALIRTLLSDESNYERVQVSEESS